MEFIRSLMENQIPQQASLQNLLLKFIMDSKDFLMMHTLLQFHVFSESLELARLLVHLGSKSQGSDQYYPPAYQLGLDMFKKLQSHEEVVIALINEGLMIKALNFSQEYHVHSMKISTFLQKVEEIRESGKVKEADIILKRITEIKKVRHLKYKTIYSMMRLSFSKNLRIIGLF